MRILCAGFDDLLAQTRYNQTSTVVKYTPQYHSRLSIIAQCAESTCILSAASPCCVHRKWEMLAGNLRLTSAVDVCIDGSCGLTSRRVTTPPGEHARILSSTRRPKVALDLRNDGGELGSLSECCLRVIVSGLRVSCGIALLWCAELLGALKRRPLFSRTLVHPRESVATVPDRGLRPGPRLLRNDKSAVCSCRDASAACSCRDALWARADDPPPPCALEALGTGYFDSLQLDLLCPPRNPPCHWAVRTRRCWQPPGSSP